MAAQQDATAVHQRLYTVGKRKRLYTVAILASPEPVLSADIVSPGRSAWAQTHNAAWLPLEWEGNDGVLLSRVCNCSTPRQHFCSCSSRLTASGCNATSGRCADLDGWRAVAFSASKAHGERSVEDPRVTFEPGSRGSKGTYWMVYSVYRHDHDAVRKREQEVLPLQKLAQTFRHAFHLGSTTTNRPVPPRVRPLTSGDLALASCTPSKGLPHGITPRWEPGKSRPNKSSSCWRRHGLINPSTLPHGKSGALLLRPNARPLLWWGEGVIALATSVNGSARGPYESISSAWMQPRPGHFDASLVEVGPPPLRLSTDDYLFLYNAANAPWLSMKDACSNESARRALGTTGYHLGWAILDGRDPSRILIRSETPLLSADKAWQRGEAPWRCNVANVVFCEAAQPLGLSDDGHGDRFRIWFGGADAHGALATPNGVSNEPAWAARLLCCAHLRFAARLTTLAVGTAVVTVRSHVVALG